MKYTHMTVYRWFRLASACGPKVEMSTQRENTECWVDFQPRDIIFESYEQLL